MRIAVRTLVLLGVFVGVGWLMARSVMGRVASRGAMEPEVRLSGAMAGLFAGGAATLVVGIAMVWLRKKS